MVQILSNIEALEQTLSELDAKGRLSSIEAAQRQMVLSMASALDQDPANAALWRQYREALKELMADDAGDDNDATGLFPSVGHPPQA